MTTVFGFTQRAAFGLGALILMTGALRSQEPPTSQAAGQHIGVPEDWSTRRVIYTRNGSAGDMSKVLHDPRFMHGTLLRYLREHTNQTRQLLTTRSNELGLSENNFSNEGDSAPQRLLPPDFRNPRRTPHARNKHSKVDWSVSLGPTAGLAVGETPSVYTYNYAVPSCSNLSAAPPTVGDFVVYTINAAPTVGTQANLVGLTNLYTTGNGSGFCSGTGPSFLFSYAIGTGGSPLSPVLSADGSRVAWIENRTATDAYLHVTIWVANQGTTAVWPAAVNGTFSNGSCTPAGSSCDLAIEYTNATYPGCPTAYKAGNGHSDLYVDYAGNSGYIGANNGLLYHIKNIFSKTISPTIDFCTPVNPTFETAPSSAMSGPVYDPLLNKVFVTDSEAMYAYTVNASSFSAASPASYTYGNSGSNFNYQTGPGPLLDVFNNYLYVFSTYDAAGNTSVTQIPTTLPSIAGSAATVQLGNRSTNANHILFFGAFDNNYYTNGPKSAASTLYGCGTGSSNNAQSLYAISFNAATGLMNSTPAMSNNRNVNLGGNSNGVCSPITEFFDGTTDRIFVGMGQPGSNSGANVVTMWNVTNQLTNTSGAGGTMPTFTAQAINYLGGTSGIAADNNAGGTAQAESIYFSTENVGATATAVAGNGYNVNGIYSDGMTFATGGLDNDGNAYSSNLLGTSLTWNGITFTFGPANALDAWANTTITLPSGQFNTLIILAAAVNSQTGTGPQTFTVNYTDGTTTTLSQTISDWFVPLGFTGESVAKTMAYRDVSDGSRDNRTFDLFGYSFAINPNKTVSSLTLPATRNVVVLAAALASNCGGKDYCAVKLTQSALQ